MYVSWLYVHQCRFSVSLNAPTHAGVPQGAPLYERYFQPGSSGNILDCSPNTGTSAQLSPRSSGLGQLFTINTDGTIIRSNGTPSICLEVQGSGNGATVLTNPCNGGSNQMWNFFNGTIKPLSAQSYCLDVSGFGTATGTVVGIWSCNGGSNQQWSLVAGG